MIGAGKLGGALTIRIDDGGNRGGSGSQNGDGARHWWGLDRHGVTSKEEMGKGGGLMGEVAGNDINKMGMSAMLVFKGGKKGGRLRGQSSMDGVCERMGWVGHLRSKEGDCKRDWGVRFWSVSGEEKTFSKLIEKHLNNSGDSSPYLYLPGPRGALAFVPKTCKKPIKPFNVSELLSPMSQTINSNVLKMFSLMFQTNCTNKTLPKSPICPESRPIIPEMQNYPTGSVITGIFKDKKKRFRFAPHLPACLMSLSHSNTIS